MTKGTGEQIYIFKSKTKNPRLYFTNDTNTKVPQAINDEGKKDD